MTDRLSFLARIAGAIGAVAFTPTFLLWRLGHPDFQPGTLRPDPARGGR